MKKVFFILVFCVAFVRVHAQTQTQAPKYTIHTVVKGETLSQLAQKNHTTITAIMQLNGMNSKSTLRIGQKVKIPTGTTTTSTQSTATKSTATKTTSAKTTKQVSTDTAVSTHYVLQGETLYSISKKFETTVDDLKQWNNLSDDNIHFGQKLIVKGGMPSSAATTTTETAQQTDSGKNVQEQTVTADSTQQETKPAPGSTAQTDATKTSENTDANNNTGNNIIFSDASVAMAAGYFKKDFAKTSEIKSMTGSAMTFNSTSGWNDKKYYILVNGIPSGSIVKVSAPGGKSIYAKVLWSLDAKDNDGLSFRVSDATAFALGITDPSFNLTIEY
jgi:LysM repeat protein